MTELSQEWFSAAEAAALRLPGLPTTVANILDFGRRNDWQRLDLAGTKWRRKAGRGGGIEFHWSVLPPEARVVWAAAHSTLDLQGETSAADDGGRYADRWDFFQKQTDKKKAEATRRLLALDMLDGLTQSPGALRTVAIAQVAAAFKVSPNAVRGWKDLVAGVPRAHWAPFLLPKHAGRTATAECSEQAWQWIKADYLRPEAPTLSDCYRDLLPIAEDKKWTVPSEDTFARRIQKEIPYAVRVLARKGKDALKQLYPPQKRDKSVLHAMQAVNADGHKIDVFVKWPGTDDEIFRPMLIVFQDLYSGKLLSCRVDRSENLEAVRLACGDMLDFGIPEHCTLDNTRTFASKRLTGGMSNRFRFKVKPDEPSGVLTTLGIQVHWSTPYAGQSKPIERAFRDFAHSLAKDPRFAGAYVGNSPMAKPENYASKAIPLDDFLAVVAERIKEHNARPGRRSDVCGGKFSFDEVFDASYAVSAIRKASEAQRRLCLMAATDVQVHKDGLHFHGNRYWADFLTDLTGCKVTIRFDPDVLQDPIHVYRIDGSSVGAAPCLEAAGFYDLAAAKEHGRKRKSWLKAQKAVLDAERGMDIAEAAALMKRNPEPPLPETKVIRPIFGNGNTALKVRPAEDELEDGPSPSEQQLNRAVRERRGFRLALVPDEEFGAEE